MPRNAPNVYNLPERHDPSRRNVVLRRIVRVHEPAVRRFLRARLANHPDHEDLVQEIYLRLLRQEDLEEKLSMGEAQTRSYLFSMSNNLIRDRFRREKVRSELSLNLIAEQTPDNRGPSPEDILVSLQTIAAIKKTILMLPALTQRAFLLSRFQELSYREIADDMNISISMVEKHIMRALAAIRSCIPAEPGIDP